VEFTKEPLPFGDGSLDYVSASFCPEHLPSARTFFEEISRVARDGATLDIWLPCATHSANPLPSSFASLGEGIFEQMCLRSPEVWRQGLEKAWLWRELNYCIAAETLQDMELHRIDLPFAIKHFKNVVHELNLVVELRNDLAVSVSHPRKTYSATRQGPRMRHIHQVLKRAPAESPFDGCHLPKRL
jgi:SAM-dependent methyltransferase